MTTECRARRRPSLHLARVLMRAEADRSATWTHGFVAGCVVMGAVMTGAKLLQLLLFS